MKHLLFLKRGLAVEGAGDVLVGCWEVLGLGRGKGVRGEGRSKVGIAIGGIKDRERESLGKLTVCRETFAWVADDFVERLAVVEGPEGGLTT